MFDTVTIRCPGCKYPEEVQTKAGPCTLEEYEAEDAPLAILDGIQGRRTCKACGARYEVHVQRLVTVRLDPRANRSREEEEDDW